MEDIEALVDADFESHWGPISILLAEWPQGDLDALKEMCRALHMAGAKVGIELAGRHALDTVNQSIQDIQEDRWEE